MTGAQRVGYRSVLRQREFAALLAADGLSVVGDQVARIAVALLVFERSGSSFAASATYACSYLTWLVGAPLLSVLADRHERRRLMVVCDVLRAGLVSLLLVPQVPLWLVFTSLALVGLLTPPFDAARSALLADVLEGERYVVGNALTNAVAQGGQLLGFLAGGAMVALTGVRGALLADVATFLLSALLLSTLVGRHRPHDVRTGEGPRRELLAGASLVLGDPRLLALLGWGLLTAAAVIAPEGLAVAVAAEAGRGPLMAAALTASVPAGFLAGTWLLLRLPAERREPLFPALVALSCLPLLLTVVVEDVHVLLALWTLAGVGNAMQLVANAAFVQAVPQHLRGRAFGFAGALLMAVQGLVLLAVGALAEATGPRVPVSLAAALALLVLPVLALSGRAARRRSQGAAAS